jgi:hypothetical protein
MQRTQTKEKPEVAGRAAANTRPAERMREGRGGDAASEEAAHEPQLSHGGPTWELSRIAMDRPERRGREQTPPLIGSPSDPLEVAADRAASSSSAVAGPGTGPRTGAAAPAAVGKALASEGRPLDARNREAFENRFQHDFSKVRLHSGPAGAQAAQSIGARAFTVGSDIVLGGQGAEPALLAHELAHVVQQSAAVMPWVQRQGVTGQTPAPRQDYVFLMGADKQGTSNPFYKTAADYFHAHLPTATFVDDRRNLGDLLSWIAANVKDPVGNLYIVSHGAEDGTLAFGLNPGDTDGHMTVMELRDALHPSGGGSTSLQSVAGVVDAQTQIHIKGCDIGRTKEMVELIDEAFGGKGTVIAPTHEQEYTTDATLGQTARRDAHDQQMGAFRAGLPALPPQPAAVDPTLKGDALKEAKKDHDDAAAALKTAQQARDTAVAAEEKRIVPDLDAVEKKAATIDALSGPMFQRPGTTQFSAAELQPEIDRLYPHLNEAQRKSLAQRLTAPATGGDDDQHGQRVQTIRPNTEDREEPLTLDEAKKLYGKEWKDQGFEPASMTPKRTVGADETELEVTFDGTLHPKGGDAKGWRIVKTYTIPSDKAMIDGGKAQTNNPDRYAWRVERTHKDGKTTLNAVGERVKAYLHHGSLDASEHKHFGQPESNPDFYAKFQPPPPTPPASSGTTKP